MFEEYLSQSNRKKISVFQKLLNITLFWFVKC